jgi:hypothetical protein
MELDEERLIVRIEDEFGIAIAEDEVCRARTLKDFHALVLSELESEPACLDGMAFYRARKALAETLGIASRSIRPMTRLEPLMPLDSRIGQWKQLSKRSGLVFPLLTHPKRWKDRFVLISMAIAAVPVIALWWSLNMLGWLPGILVWLFVGPAFIAWFVLISRINQTFLVRTPRLATELPFTTAAELSLSVLALNEQALEGAAEAVQVDERLVWARIAAIVGEELKIDPQDVSPGMRIGQNVGVS